MRSRYVTGSRRQTRQRPAVTQPGSKSQPPARSRRSLACGKLYITEGTKHYICHRTKSISSAAEQSGVNRELPGVRQYKHELDCHGCTLR
jgi:hypothetical protein